MGRVGITHKLCWYLWSYNVLSNMREIDGLIIHPGGVGASAGCRNIVLQFLKLTVKV